MSGKLVGRTGFEPVTFSVSGRRAPAAPTARDDESLPDSGSGGVHHDELRWRAVQVRPGQLVLVLYQAERGLHDRHSSPRTHFPHEDFSSGQQAWSWSMKMGCVRSRARAERELLAGSLAITGLAVVCLWSAYVSLVWRPYRGRTSGSCGGGSNDHSKTAPVLAGWLSAETDYVPRHLRSNQASQPRPLRRASAAARTVPCCCCRRTS